MCDWQLSSTVKLKEFWRYCDAKQRADLVLVHKVRMQGVLDPLPCQLYREAVPEGILLPGPLLFACARVSLRNASTVWTSWFIIPGAQIIWSIRS